MALVITPGAANANSYADLAEADAYALTNPYASGWDTLASGEKEACLITATRLLDSNPYAWTGSAVDDVQALGWPRNGMLSRNNFPIPNTIIPQLLKDATSEFARQLALGDRTQDNDIVNQGITSVKAGSVSVSFANKLAKEEASWVIIPDVVRNMLPQSWLRLTPEQQILVNKGTLLFEEL